MVLLSAAALWRIPIAALAGTCLFWGIGLADDLHRFKATRKLLLQAAALLAVVLLSGTNALAGIAIVVLGLILINAFNVLDGLNGLASGVAFFALLPTGLSGQPCHEVAGLAAGFSVAFLLFNVSRAWIFLGDQGSQALGFMLWFVTFCALLSDQNDSGVGSAFIWLVPGINATFVAARRLKERRPILVGDRAHLYDVLHRRIGLRATLAIAWVGAAIGGVAAVVLA